MQAEKHLDNYNTATINGPNVKTSAGYRASLRATSTEGDFERIMAHFNNPLINNALRKNSHLKG